MLDSRIRLIQKRIRSACDEVFRIETDIGELLARPITPDDAGVRFRCRLLLNRCADTDAKLEALYSELPESRDSAVSRALIMQNRELIALQRSTLRSLIRCLNKNSAISIEAKRAQLIAETALVRERIKNNAKGNPS